MQSYPAGEPEDARHDTPDRIPKAVMVFYWVAEGKPLEEWFKIRCYNTVEPAAGEATSPTEGPAAEDMYETVTQVSNGQQDTLQNNVEAVLKDADDFDAQIGDECKISARNELSDNLVKDVRTCLFVCHISFL